MSTIVEATIPAGQFVLPETLLSMENLEFRAVRLVAHESGRVMPFLWASSDDLDRLYETIADDSTVTGVDVIAEFDGECLLRVDWESSVRVLVSILSAEDAMLLDISGYEGVWHLELFFSDPSLIPTTTEFCEQYGIDLSIEAVNALSGVSEYGYFGLTERQYETIVQAYEYGYYDVPRAVNQEELADHFGVSHQALSERLRRAHETIISNALYHTIHRRGESVYPQVRTEADT